jgi:hypothetical protein
MPDPYIPDAHEIEDIGFQRGLATGRARRTPLVAAAQALLAYWENEDDDGGSDDELEAAVALARAALEGSPDAS